jgi:hypothetical protein
MQEWISSPIGMHPVESGQWVLAADAYAERDRLAAEISAANTAYASLLESHELILDALTESDAMLDRLREVVPKWDSCNAWGCSTAKVKAILYPENET